MSPLTHLTDSHSKPWASVWNQHWACRKWEISTGDRGGREGGGGDKRKTGERSIDLTFGIQVSTLHVMLLLPFPISPPLLACLSIYLAIYLSFYLRLHEHLLAVCVRACSCACVYIVSLKGSSYERLRACFFSWHSNSLAKPRKWTSSELFQRGLVFVVPRSKTTWPHVTSPQLLAAGTQRSLQGVGGRSRHNHAVHQTQMSPRFCSKCFTWKQWFNKRGRFKRCCLKCTAQGPGCILAFNMYTQDTHQLSYTQTGWGSNEGLS